MKLTTILALLTAFGLSLMAEQPGVDPFRPLAERYVRLVLAVGQHDADYVDAYYGPPELRKEAKAQKLPLPDIETRAAALESDIGKASLPASKEDAELWRLRKQYLVRQLQALRARVSMLQGRKLTFDQESLSLYDAVAPRHTEAY